MDMESINGKMEEYIQVIGKMVINTGLAFFNISMIHYQEVG